MNKKYRQFQEAFKLQVIEEVLSGQLTKEQARRKYNIKGSSAILNWIRSFGVANCKTVPAYFAAMKAQQNLTQEELLKRVRELERALEDAQLRVEGYSRMIDIAERELKISIRKKSNTKQSGK
jgi:transposase-like protein